MNSSQAIRDQRERELQKGTKRDTKMPKRNAHGITNKVSRVAGCTARTVIWRENVSCVLMYLNTWSLVGGALWGDYKPLGLGVFQRKYITRGGLYSLFLLPLLALCFLHIDGNVVSS